MILATDLVTLEESHKGNRTPHTRNVLTSQLACTKTPGQITYTWDTALSKSILLPLLFTENVSQQ